MQIKGMKILEFITFNKDYYIPFYQRNYTWGEKEVTELLEDIYENKNDGYYLGNIVIKTNHNTTIVDGQQRISTIFLMLKALSNNMMEDISNKKLNIDYSLNTNFNSDNLKDGMILKKIISNEPEISSIEKETNYYQNFLLIDKFIKGVDVLKFYEQLLKVEVAYIGVDANVDEHKLFAQINSTGKKLTCFDLVKNYLFSQVEATKVNLYLEKIGKITDNLNDVSKASMLRHYCSYVTSDLPNKNDIVIYKKIKDIYMVEEDAIKTLNEIYEFGLYYNFIESDLSNVYFAKELSILKKSFNTYSVLLVDIFKKNSCIDGGEIKFEDKQKEEIKNALLVLEAYKIRREFVNLKEKEITRFIPTIPKQAETIINWSYDKKLINILLNDANDKDYGYRMPTINEFKIGMEEVPIYNTNKFVKSFLMRLENSDKNEVVQILDKDITIEHIMPQSIDKWIDDINFDEMIHQKRIHSIGNLTLLAGRDNSSIKNDSFTKKRIYLQEKSRIKLNNELVEYDCWNYDTIIERTNKLFEKCNLIWKIENKYQTFDDFEINNEKLEASNDHMKKYVRMQNYSTFNKNISSFIKVGLLNYSDVKSILYNLYINGSSTISNEKEVFDITCKGWIAQSIYDAMGINAPLAKGTLTDEQFVERIKELNREIELFVNYVNENIRV